MASDTSWWVEKPIEPTGKKTTVSIAAKPAKHTGENRKSMTERLSPELQALLAQRGYE